MSKAYVEVPGKVWLVVIGGSSLGLLSSNPFLTVASLMILPFLVFPLWRKGEPPILSFILFYQWLEATLKVFNADLAGVPIEGVVKLGEGNFATYFYSKEAGRAVWLCLGALASLAMGMRLGSKGIRTQPPPPENPSLSIKKLFFFYLIAFIVFALSDRFIWYFLPLSQFLLALMSVKWVLLFLLVFTVLQRKSNYVYLALAFILEIAAGFLAYFSQFKGIIFILALAFLTLHFRLRARHALASVLILLAALYLGSLWTVVKKEYRTFLDQAEQGGRKLSLEEKVKKMGDLASGFDVEKIRTGFLGLTERVAYIDYFSQVLQVVPRVVPHADGELWKKALRHILTPRFFFQGKPVLESDSVITRKYTGILVAGTEEGRKTSIGIGYFAESYVDFGSKWMFIPIFFLGLLEGWVYRYFVCSAKTRLMGSAMSVAALFISANSIATNSTKILGGVVTNFIVLVLVLKLFERPFIRAVTSRSFVRRTPRIAPLTTN